jgi:hypothetical protein
LRAIRDQLTRERLAIPEADMPRYRGCRCWLHEHTPGCAHCRYRHAARRLRLRLLFAEREHKRRRPLGLAPWTPKPASLPIVEAIDDVLDE